jgi:hypothetical protein
MLALLCLELFFKVNYGLSLLSIQSTSDTMDCDDLFQTCMVTCDQFLGKRTSVGNEMLKCVAIKDCQPERLFVNPGSGLQTHENWIVSAASSGRQRKGNSAFADITGIGLSAHVLTFTNFKLSLC